MEAPSHHYPDDAMEPGDGCLSLQKKAQIANLRLSCSPTTYHARTPLLTMIISPSGKAPVFGDWVYQEWIKII